MQPMVWPPHLVAGAGNFPDSCLGGADTEVACSAASASLPFSTHLLSCVYQKNTYTRQGNDFIGNRRIQAWLVADSCQEIWLSRHQHHLEPGYL